MKRDNKAIKLGLLATGFWYFFLRGAIALRVGLKSVRLVEVFGDRATVEIMLYVYNPTLASVLVRSLRGTVSVMGMPVGEIDYPVNARIKARRTAVVPVMVDVSSSAFGEAMWNNIQTGHIETMAIELNGSVVCGEKVPISYPIRKLWVWQDIIDSKL